MLIIRHFSDEHYSIVFSQETGFFARVEDPGHDEPLWSPSGPELLDISITSWCDQGCSFCYRRSTTAGQHMSMEDFDWLMREARSAGVLQVAYGGGNPNQHPQFPEILRKTREEYGIVPSYTTNGRGLSANVLSATAKYCGGVAVSAYAPYKQTQQAVDRLIAVGVRPNIHQVFSKQSIPLILEWLDSPPDWLQRANALILLNYKPIGWEHDEQDVAAADPRWREVVRRATSESFPFGIGFDNCCITGLNQESKAHPASIEACDAGRFSMFVSEHLEAYPCSFMAEMVTGHQLRGRGLLNVWHNSVLFREFRQRLVPESCGGDSQSACLGGCHLFPEINFCACGREKSSVLNGKNQMVQITVSGENAAS